MRVLFVQRHGDAECAAAGGERVLTAAGEVRLRRAAVNLAGRGLVLGAIAHSPLARTRQSAQVMARLLTPGATPVASPHLAPASAPAVAACWLAEHTGGAEPRLIIAHMPEVAQWTALWAGAGPRGFAPGSMARLEVLGDALRPGAARLTWLRSVEALADPSLDL